LFHTSPGNAVAAYEKDYSNLTFVIIDLTTFGMKLPVSWQFSSLIPATTSEVSGSIWVLDNVSP
jgi:hypothetical protein